MRCRSIYGPELPFNTQAAAHHEAGHAAMVLFLGGFVEQMGLGPDDEGQGLAYIDAGFERYTTRRMMLYTLAGNSAERIFRNQRQKLRLSQTDLQILLTNTAREVFGDGEWAFVELLKSKPPSRHVQAVERQLLLPPGKRRPISPAAAKLLQARFAHYAAECFEILSRPRVWRAVEVIASDLAASGHLNAKKIDRLYWFAMKSEINQRPLAA